MDNTTTYRRSTCRLCDSALLNKVLDFCPSVPVDNYRPRMHKNIDSASYGMDLYLCQDCGHAQLLDVVAPDILFGDYIYTSSSSPGLEAHFRELVATIFEKFSLSPDDLVIDVGCNDGLLLSLFKSKGVRTLGIDPARAALDAAKLRGLETFEAFLTAESVNTVVSDHGHASLVTATNVFSHADDMVGFAGAVHALLKADGWFVFEVSYLKNLLFSGVWDYVYHEHLAHHSIRPLTSFLRRIGFDLISVQQLPIKGGSLRCFAQKTSSPRGLAMEIAELLVEEELQGLYALETYRRVAKCRSELRALTDRLCSSIPKPSVIASYGASATCTVLSQELGYAHRISFVVDDNGYRQRTLSPGFLVPVLSCDELERLKPQLLIISAWRFRDKILAQCDKYLQNGGKIYVPLPTPHIITKTGWESLGLSASAESRDF